jgi:hypothetical protein
MTIDPGEIFASALADFGGPVTIGITELSGLWQEPMAAQTLDGRVEMTAPALLVVTSELPAGTVHGSEVVRGAVTYYVRGMEPDGLGATLLILSED